MSYVALYRKFRPDSFADVKGQDHIVTTLKNQLKAGRIGHAYLFTGTRGTGKTTVAKILAKAVNCENPTEDGPCGECPTCKAIASGASLNVIEIDAASNNGVDSIREIVDEVSYRPTQGNYKVYIIDEVHMLSNGAFNAMLKTLEEPPSYVIFILATTEVHKLPITVLSRCQRYDFKRISIDTIADRMRELMSEEKVEVEDRAIRYIAKAADGSLRDGLSLLDQCIAFNLGETLTYDKALEVLGAVDTGVFSALLRGVLERDPLQCIHILDEIVMQGRELNQFVIDFTWYLRNLMLIQTSDDLEDVVDMSTDNLAKLKEESQMADRNQIIRYIRIFSELSNQIRYASQKRVLIEVALIKLCKPAMEKNDDSLYDRISALEQQLENGVVVQATAGGISGNGMNSDAGGAAQKKAKPILPEAVPEDIRKIVGSWKSICSNSDFALASALQSGKPSLAEDGSLLIVYNTGDCSMDRLQTPAKQEKLAEIFADLTGKEVRFTIKEAKDGDEFDNGVVDLRRVINFDIIEEDEE